MTELSKDVVERLVQRLTLMADQGDMGRKPDAGDTRRLSAAALRALQSQCDRYRVALEPFAAMGRVIEARAKLTFGRTVPDSEIVSESSGEVGMGILVMGHFRDAAALLPAAPGWGGYYRSPIRTALSDTPTVQS